MAAHLVGRDGESADAGPWALPACPHDCAADPELQPGRPPISPAAFELRSPADATAGTYGGPVLLDVTFAAEAPPA